MTRAPARILAARQILAEPGVTLDDLQDEPAKTFDVPALAEYLPMSSQPQAPEPAAPTQLLDTNGHSLGRPATRPGHRHRPTV